MHKRCLKTKIPDRSSENQIVKAALQEEQSGWPVSRKVPVSETFRLEKDEKYRNPPASAALFFLVLGLCPDLISGLPLLLSGTVLIWNCMEEESLPGLFPIQFPEPG